KGYDVDLAGLRLGLLEMGGLVLDQVQRAVNALVNGDEALARSVLTREEEVDAYDGRIDEDCVTLIARRQPMGSDLRAIISIARAVSDLERIGDEAKKIARAVLRGDGKRSTRPSPQLARDARHIARFAQDMLRDALDAFDRMDPVAGGGVVRGDKEVNADFQGRGRVYQTRRAGMGCSSAKDATGDKRTPRFPSPKARGDPRRRKHPAPDRW